jgi:hypothetical protein
MNPTTPRKLALACCKSSHEHDMLMHGSYFFLINILYLLKN